MKGAVASTPPRPIIGRALGGAVGAAEDKLKLAPGCMRASPIGAVGKGYHSLGMGAFDKPLSGWEDPRPRDASIGSIRVRTSGCEGRKGRKFVDWPGASPILRRGTTSALGNGDGSEGAGIVFRMGTLEPRWRIISERGTISIRKSNRSERAIAFAMSERWMVRRLFSSATMKARQVRSAMKTLEKSLEKQHTKE